MIGFIGHGAVVTMETWHLYLNAYQNSSLAEGGRRNGEDKLSDQLRWRAGHMTRCFHHVINCSRVLPSGHSSPVCIPRVCVAITTECDVTGAAYRPAPKYNVYSCVMDRYACWLCERLGEESYCCSLSSRVIASFQFLAVCSHIALYKTITTHIIYIRSAMYKWFFLMLGLLRVWV